jgi:hypothetical protein
MSLHAVSLPCVAEAFDNPVVLSIRSRIPGRERWDVPVLRDHPALAGAVELLLRAEPGVIEAHANPVSGRLLIRFDPGRITAPVEQLIRSAVSFGPLNSYDVRISGREAGRRNAVRSFILVELGCVLLKSALLAGRCAPGGAIAAAAMFLFLRHRHD